MLFITPETPFPILTASLSKPQFKCHLFHEAALCEDTGPHCSTRTAVGNTEEWKENRSALQSQPMLTAGWLGYVLNPLGWGLLIGKTGTSPHKAIILRITWYTWSTNTGSFLWTPDWLYGQFPHISAFKFVNNFYYSPLSLFPNKWKGLLGKLILNMKQALKYKAP